MNMATSLEDVEALSKSISEVITCVVCLEPLRPKTVICIKGHVICEDCKGNQIKCPTCRQDFSTVETTGFIQQILEVLPHTCRYSPCPAIVIREDDHEQFCKFKPTQCRLCGWNGPGKELVDHIKDGHAHFKLLTGSSCVATNVYLNRKQTDSNIFSAFEHLLWYERSNNPATGLLTNKFFLVFNGKPDHDFFVKLGFKSKFGDEYITSIKLKLNARENCIIVPNSALIDFIDSENKLQYTLVITKQSTCS